MESIKALHNEISSLKLKFQTVPSTETMVRHLGTPAFNNSSPAKVPAYASAAATAQVIALLQSGPDGFPVQDVKDLLYAGFKPVAQEAA